MMNLRLTGLASLLALAAGAGAGLPPQFLECNAIVEYDKSVGIPADAYGWAVADLRDIDGDGFTDWITGAPFAADIGPINGRTFVYSGADGSEIFTIDGAPGELMGYAVADAGDVNNDGTFDFITGGPASGGRARVYSGVDGSLLHEFTAPADASSFGAAVAGLGDINDDGHSDVVVGASNSFSVAGAFDRAFVFSGADGSLIFELFPETNGEFFGLGTAGVGDIDGDDVPDIFIGAFGGGANGRAYLFSGADASLIFPPFEAPATGAAFGQFFVAAAGDVNADGTTDLYVGDFGDDGGRGRAFVYSGADRSILREFVGETANSGLGPGRGAGDVDGDGFDDLIIGDYTSSVGERLAGKAIVYSGRNGAVLRTFTSLNTNNENLGFDAVGLGDVTGDGLIDFLVSAANASNVYLFSGEGRIPADFDVDGNVGSTELATLLGAWGPCPAIEFNSPQCPDLNGDQVVNGADLAQLLGRWGACSGVPVN